MQVPLTYEAAVEYTREEVCKEGFWILTEIVAADRTVLIVEGDDELVIQQ